MRTHMIRRALPVLLAILVPCIGVLPQLAMPQEVQGATEEVWHTFEHSDASFDVVRVIDSNGKVKSIYARDDSGNRVGDVTLERRLVVAAQNWDDLDDAWGTCFQIPTSYGPSCLYAVEDALADRSDDEGHWYSTTYPTNFESDWLIDNVYEEGWIDKGLDDYDKRVKLWKIVIWSTVLSQATTEQRDKLSEEVDWLLEQVENESDNSDVILLAGKIRSNEVLTTDMLGSLSTLFSFSSDLLLASCSVYSGAELVTLFTWSQYLTEMSDLMATASWLSNLRAELIQSVMWNLLASAEAKARLDVIADLSSAPEWDPALRAALPHIRTALDEYGSSLGSALWEGLKSAVLSSKTFGFLMSVKGNLLVAKGAVAIASALGLAVGAWLVPVALVTYAAFRLLYDHITELHDQVRGLVLTATLNRLLEAYMPTWIPATLEDVEFIVRANSMGYYLENYYYVQYRDYNNMHWFSSSDRQELNSQLEPVISSSLDSYWLTAAPYWLATDEWPDLGKNLATPTVIIDTPNDGDSVSGTVSISAHATDDDGIAEMTLKIGGTSITSGVTVDMSGASATLSYEWDTSTIDRGSACHILVKAKDSSGEESDDLVRVRIETDAGEPPPASNARMNVSATGPIMLDGHSVSEIAAVVTEENGDPIGGVEIWFWSYPSDYAGFAEPDGTLLSPVNLYIATTSYTTGEAVAYYRPTRWGRTYIMAETRTGLSAQTYFDSVYEPAAPADFHIDVSPTARNAGRSESATYEVTVVPENGYYRPVTLSAEDLPPGVTVSGTVVLPGEPTTIQVSVGNSAPYGTHTFRFVGTGDGFSRSEDAVLVVKQGAIAITSPNGGEVWYMGETHDVTWSYTGGGSVTIDYSHDGGRNWSSFLISEPNTGSEPLSVSSYFNRPYERVLFRVRAASDDSAVDVSDDFFKVCDDTLHMRLISPAGGEVLPPGSFNDIKWSTVNDVEVAGVDILFSSDGGATWTTVVENYPDLGVYRWHLPTEQSDQCRIRLVATDASAKTGEVEGNNFAIGLDTGAWFPNRIGYAPECIAVDPTNSAIAYLGEDGSGVWKTEDAGRTIILLENGPVDVVDVEIDPSNTSIVYACDEGEGLWRTTDGGDTWEVIASGDVYYPPWDCSFSMDWAMAVALHPGDSNTIFLGSDEGLFKSTDWGGSWEFISDEDPWEKNLIIDPNNPNIMYMGAGSCVKKSVDGGYSWADVGSLSGYIGDLVMNPQNSSVLYAAANGGLYRTADAGGSWSPLIQGTAWDDINAVVVDPTDSNTIYAGPNEPKGVLRSTDGGSTWDFIGPFVGSDGCDIDALGMGTTPSKLLYAGSRSGIDGVWVKDLDPPPAAIIVSPNGDEEWMAGSNQDILWTTTDSDGAGPVDLYHSDTGDTPWEIIATGLADTGNYSWKLPIIPGGNYKVRVVVHNVEGQTVEAISEETFTVIAETMPPAISEIGVGEEAPETLGIHPLTPSRVSKQTPGGLAGEIGTLITISARASDSLSGVDPTSVEAHLQYPDETDVAVISLHDDGTGPDEIAGDGIFTGQWDSSGAIEAFHFVDISASDLSGNERVVDNAVLVEVFDYPSVTGISYDPSSPTDQAGVTVDATITDTSGISIAGIEYSSDGGQTWPSVSMHNTGGNEWSGTIPQLSAGTVQFRIVATDTLGRSMTTITDTYDVLDVTPPTVYIIGPTGNSTPTRSAIEIGFTEAMDTSSVEGAISISPAVNYSSFWIGDRLLIIPDDRLAGETEYTVTVTGTAQDNAGNGLDGDSDGIAEGSPDDDYSWSFATSSQIEFVTKYLPAGQMGVPYEAALEATGGTEPYTWEIVAGHLPDGLDLDTGTGVISGTPTEVEDFPFTVQVTDDGGLTATQVLAITVDTPEQPCMRGEIREVNCDILTGATITVYQDGARLLSLVNDGDGRHAFTVPALGDYDVVASKDGFRSETRSISVTESRTYTIDFVADHGLIPNAASMSYVLGCINLWQFGEPPCKLTMSTVLAVINAWQFPVQVLESMP